MTLDTSIFVAIILREPGYEGLLQRIGSAPVVRVGAATLFEAGLVLTSRLRLDVRPYLEGLLLIANAEVVPFSKDHFETALQAFERFGKGRHSAALNFGDCLSYATAKLTGLPILFIGNDFAQTDLPAA